MNKADIEFTVGLDTSPAEQSLSNLYNDMQSHNNRMQKLLGNPQKYSEQRYLSNLSKLEKMQDVYGIDKVTVNSNLPGNEYHRFMNLQNAVARYEREINKLEQKSNSVISAVNAYSSSKNTVDAHPGMFEGRIRSITEMELERLTIEKNKSIASGAYETWKNLTSNNILALPAPEAPKKDELTKQKPAKERLKAVTDEDKKDNIELNEKLFKWGKIAAIIYSVKKVLEGLSKVWQFGAETVSSRNANLNQDLGYFSIDPEGALRANTDTTRGMLYAGIRNMGKTSPVSKGGLDYTAQKFTDMWTAAMSGREVDARTTIDVQRLRDFFGIDISPAAILTGQREGKTATDLEIDVLRRVETQLSKLNTVDQTTKGQVIDSLRNLLGDEMVNALVANYNKNARSNSNETVVEKLLNAGSSTMNGMDLTDKTNSAVTAMAQFKNSIEELKNTIIVDLSPAFINLTNAITSLVDWINKKAQVKSVADDLAPTSLGATTPHNKVVKATATGNVIGNKTDRSNYINELLKSPSTAEDILNAVYLLNPNISEESIESTKQRQFADEAFEALLTGTLDPESTNPIIKKLSNYEYWDKKKKKMLKGIEALRAAEKKGAFGKGSTNYMFRSAIKGDYSSFLEPKLEDYQAGGKFGLKNPTAKESQQYYEKAYKTWKDLTTSGLTDFLDSKLFAEIANENFGEGGAYDFNEQAGDVWGYLFDQSHFDSPDSYYDYIANLISSMKETGAGKEYIKNITLPSKEQLWGEDKKLQFAEVRFTLETTTGQVLSSVNAVGEIVDSTQ